MDRTILVKDFASYDYIANVCSSIELFKMVCEADEDDVDIGIPVVMLPQDAGHTLIGNIQKNLNGKY